MNPAHTLSNCSGAARQELSSHYIWLPNTFHRVKVGFMLYKISVKFFTSFWMHMRKQLKKLTLCFQSLTHVILPAWAGLTPVLCISLSHGCCNSPEAQQLLKETSQVLWRAVLFLWLESCLFTGLAQLPVDKNKGKSNCFMFSPRLTGASAQAALQAWQALLTLSVSAALSSVQTTASEASFVPRCLTCTLILFQSWIHPRNLELLDGTGLDKIKGRYTMLWWGDNWNHQVLPLGYKVHRNNCPL